MRVTMVKKRLRSGEPCRKCAQTEDMLRRRGLWDRIDEVVWADEAEPESPGMLLAARFQVEQAPFFVVHQDDGAAVVYESALKLIKERLTNGSDTEGDPDEVAAAAARLAGAEPETVLRWGLERYGTALGIAFSGAEDVVLIDMAAETGLPFSVFSLDTGRLDPETYQFIDDVRRRYGVEIAAFSPDPAALEPFVQRKGLFSFYEDGHKECCAIRKVAPLQRALAGLSAWATGQRRDQNPETRSALDVIEVDPTRPLVKLNPLAGWTSEQVWDYILDRNVPHNPLHARGYRSIGCAPCTRPVLPGQHEREGRWWWERADSKECGLHVDSGESK
jgi:phosphoadenosine phosphosulfate reductase